MDLRAFAIAALIIAPHAAGAIGSDDDEPPQPTQTTIECPEGSIYDEEAEACVVIQESLLDDDALYRAARELAYFGRLDDALAVLGQISRPEESRVQTYFAFVNRQLGNDDLARTHYAAALNADPDNLLARAYLGMFHITKGEMAEARQQLQEIQARGGAGSWPHDALSEALSSGTLSDY